MKKLLLPLLAGSLIIFTATTVLAEQEQHRYGKDGEETVSKTFEQRKAHMLNRMEQRKQCVTAATSSEELKLCQSKKGKGKRAKKQSGQQ